MFEEKFNHGEAFHLMQYIDQITGKIEIIWNSRDGVTPFCETSKEGNEAQHVDWNADKFARFHVPKIGDRIFVTATHSLVEERAKEFVDNLWNHDAFPMSEAFQDIEGDDNGKKEAAYEKAIRNFVDCGDQPWTVIVDERLHEMFQRAKDQYGESVERQKRFDEREKDKPPTNPLRPNQRREFG